MDWLAFFIHHVFNMPIYLFLILLWCWCIDTKQGFKLGTTLLVSTGINLGLKNALKAPRPFQRDPSVFRVEEHGWSTPSGHSQSAGTFWPLFAKYTGYSTPKNKAWQKTWKILIAILLPLVVAFSRNYLGVHYPTDVLGGLLIGFIFALATLFWFDKIQEAFLKLRKILRVLIIAVISAALIAMCPSDTSMAGAFFGFALGSILMSNSDGSYKFEANEGVWWKKLLRFLVGAVLVGIFYLGLKMILPANDTAWGPLCRFLRYGLCGFTITFGAPRLFIVMKLAERK